VLDWRSKDDCLKQTHFKFSAGQNEGFGTALAPRLSLGLGIDKAVRTFSKHDKIRKNSRIWIDLFCLMNIGWVMTDKIMEPMK
jgi:hypothetical protein